MKTDSNCYSTDGTRITVDIPIQDGRLFQGEATSAILLFLTRRHDESFSMTDIDEAADRHPSSVLSRNHPSPVDGPVNHFLRCLQHDVCDSSLVTW